MGASMDGYNLNFSKMPLFWRSMIFKCWQGDVRFAYLGAVRVSYKHVDQRLWHRQSGGWRGCKKSWGLSQLKVFFHRRTPLIMAKSGTLELKWLPSCKTARTCVGERCLFIISFAFASVFLRSSSRFIVFVHSAKFSRFFHWS